MNESTLEALVEGANSDIRLILGQLQMVRLSSRALSYDEVKVCQLLSHRCHMLCVVCGCDEDILFPACLTSLGDYQTALRTLLRCKHAEV